MLLFKDSEFVCELDCSATNVRDLYFGFSVDESANSLYVAGLEDNDNVSVEFDLSTGALKSEKSFMEMSDNEVNFSDYTATSDGDMCKMDSLGNIMKIDISSMTPKTMVDNDWYNPLFLPVTIGDDTFGDRFFDSEILRCNEERTVIHEMDISFYGMNASGKSAIIAAFSALKELVAPMNQFFILPYNPLIFHDLPLLLLLCLHILQYNKCLYIFQ